jgi:hypothetical protein
MDPTNTVNPVNTGTKRVGNHIVINLMAPMKAPEDPIPIINLAPNAE